MCKIMVQNYNFLEAYTDKIYDTIIVTVSTYIEEIEDEDQLRALIFEKDYDNRDSLDLISKYNINEIMDNKNMEKIALELWTSQYDVKGNLMTTSSILKIILYDSFNKPRDIISDYSFFNWKYRSTDNFDHHLYQFSVWKRSMKAKFIVEGIFLLILTMVFQYYIINSMTNYWTAHTAFVAMRMNVDASMAAVLEEQFYTNIIKYYDVSQAVITLGYISVAFPIRILLVMMFAIKSNRRFEFLRVVNYIDIALATVFFMRIYYEFTEYRSGYESSMTERERAYNYVDNIFMKDPNAEKVISYLHCSISTLLWLRVIILFKLTRFLGPLVQMIQNMILDIMLFMVLFIVQLIVFATIGNILFIEIDEYRDLYTSCKTLFDASLGNYSFALLENNGKGEVVGDAFLFVFIILNAILLLNLLIAILSSTYAMLEDKKIVLYINEILRLRSSLEYDENCSSLVSTFPPYNGITLAVSPFIMMKKNSSKVNNILFHIEYLPLLLLISMFYIGLNLVLLPFAYLKGIYVTLQQAWNNKIEVHVSIRITRFLIF
jgi:hypothetical protein